MTKQLGGLILFWAAAAAAEPATCPIRVSTKYVSGFSMSELFKPEDRIEVEEGWYGCHAVERGDVVLLQASQRKRPLLKMAQVLPGDRFALTRKGRLLVNGKVLRTPHGEAYAFSGRAARMLRLYEKSFRGRMPSETYFVFGTTPGGSLDSTKFGPVSKSAFMGRVRRKT